LWVSPSFIGDHGVAAVAVVLGAPAAADQPAEIDVEAVVLRPAAVDAADAEIGVMAGDHLVGSAGASALKIVSTMVIG
jgi:hypothetical protein